MHANPNQMISMTRNGVFDCLCELIKQNLPSLFVELGLRGIQNFLTFGALMSRKEATNNKYLVKLKQKNAVDRIKIPDSEVSKLALAIRSRYLKEHLLKKKPRLKRAILCFRNERHSLYGLFQDKKKGSVFRSTCLSSLPN